jgi:hypothetical protein
MPLLQQAICHGKGSQTVRRNPVPNPGGSRMTMKDEAAGAKTGIEGLNALFDAFKAQDRSQDIEISATVGETLDLKREVLLIRIGNTKFLTTEQQAIGLAREIVRRAGTLSIPQAMQLGEFAGALAAAVDSIQRAKRQTTVH